MALGCKWSLSVATVRISLLLLSGSCALQEWRLSVSMITALFCLTDRIYLHLLICWGVCLQQYLPMLLLQTICLFNTCCTALKPMKKEHLEQTFGFFHSRILIVFPRCLTVWSFAAAGGERFVFVFHVVMIMILAVDWRGWNELR